MFDLPGAIMKKPLWAFCGRLLLAHVLTFALCFVLAGCGGGYAGGVIPSLATSHVTIDSGQSFMAVANNPSNLQLTWSVSGSGCSGQACGTVSDTSALGATYVAPAVTQPITVTLTGSVTGTKATTSTSIVVNPAPKITGTTSDATVGTAYSATFAVSGGTPALKWLSPTGTLPAGLSFDTTTGILSGTPTAVGTSSFTLRAVDSSDVPFTVSSALTLKVNAGTNTTTPLQATGSTPDGTVNAPYSAVLQATGGTAPYTWSISTGTLPAGLSISSAGVISGTPTAAGTSTFTAQVTDAANTTATLPLTLKINAASSGGSLSIALSTLPSGTVQVPYAASITITGGTAPYTCTVSSGSLPAGLSLGSNCAVTGIPTTAGTSTFTVNATDASSPSISGSGPITIVINPAPAVLTIASPPAATVGVPYSGSVPVTGGTAPYTCTVSSGSMPAGLTLNADCSITGTPQTAGATSVGITATDSANPANSSTETVTITVDPPIATLTITSPPPATVNVPYTGTIGVTGGTAPYTCTVVSGSLPAGLTLNADCTITGTATTPGSYTVGITATDSGNPATTKTDTITLTVNASPATLTLTAPPAGTVGVAYTGTVGVTGGTAPYTCLVASGSLPAGLTLNADCSITGTPTTAGTSTVNITATDSASPANSTTAPVAVTVQNPAVTLIITSPPAATVNTPYTGAIGVAGGTGPYTCAINSGSLPAGLTLGANCTVTGTPTTAGTSTVSVTATDSASPANTKTSPVSITVQPAPATLTITAPPAATVNTPYSGTIGVTGGTAPYTCSIASGSLPAGLTLGANCTVTGTPTVAGTSTVSVTATDSANPANTKTSPVTITVQPAPATLTITAPPTATVGTPYNGTIGVTGGTAPYTCTVASGTLPAGLTLGANCTITGTPTTAGTFTVSITATDSANPANTKTSPVTITVQPAPVTLALTAPAAATVSTPYTGAIGVTGGTAPYTCTINSGTLPAGLTMAANCAITGTPTATGTSTINVTAKDSSNPANTGTANIPVTVNPLAALTLTGTLPNAVVNVAYPPQTLQATGGLAPYTYAVTSGSLPAGLSLSSDGTVSGTPTTIGVSTFTITATDSQSTPQTASLPLTLQVVYAPTPSDALLKGPYAFLFQGYDNLVAGVFAYQNATIGSITADGSGVITTGELDSNHQGSTPTGNTIATNALLGTYTLGTDGRGTLAVTTMNADGTAGNTAFYSLTLKLPTAPATASSSGSMIESDGNILFSSKGSGTLLAQNTSAYSNGLSGNYAFGVSGDTPCLPTCILNVTGLLAAGPVATVGQFTATGGTITGVSDANIATTNYNSSTLSGSSTGADPNGRISLTLNSQGLSGVSAYPTDYAVYLVDATHAFLMSTDKHSAYVLQAGTAQLQSQASFTNANLNGPFVGYENAGVNPGILGQTLESVANLSSATIIRGTGNSAGTCNTTNADMGGTTGLLNTLTGLGSGSNLVNAVLGTYQQLGTSSCNVGSNGRVVFNYPQPTGLVATLLALVGLGNDPAPPRVVYLTDNNAGYFLETGYAGLGHMEAQTAAPFTLDNLKGTYVYGTVPASSVATINGDGTFTADGVGNITSTTDTNVGVGSIPVLQLGITTNGTYSLTDVTAGRYLTNDGRIVYAISPGRFVILEGGLLSTAPYTALLY